MSETEVQSAPPVVEADDGPDVAARSAQARSVSGVGRRLVRALAYVVAVAAVAAVVVGSILFTIDNPDILGAAADVARPRARPRGGDVRRSSESCVLRRPPRHRRRLGRCWRPPCAGVCPPCAPDCGSISFEPDGTSYGPVLDRLRSPLLRRLGAGHDRAAPGVPDWLALGLGLARAVLVPLVGIRLPRYHAVSTHRVGVRSSPSTRRPSSWRHSGLLLEVRPRWIVAPGRRLRRPRRTDPSRSATWFAGKSLRSPSSGCSAMAIEWFRSPELSESRSSLAFIAGWLWPVVVALVIAVTVTQVGLWDSRWSCAGSWSTSSWSAPLSLIFAGVYFAMLLALSSPAVGDPVPLARAAGRRSSGVRRRPVAPPGPRQSRTAPAGGTQ